MHKASIIMFSALALVGTVAVAKPLFMSSPTFTDAGTTLTASGSLDGLAGDLELSLSATGTETVVCADSGGMDPPPKQVVLTGVQVVTVLPGANVAPVFEALTSLAPPAPACQGSEANPLAPQHDVAFTNVKIEIRPVQADPMLPPMKPVRCIQCTFNPATLDGAAAPQSCFTMSSC